MNFLVIFCFLSALAVSLGSSSSHGHAHESEERGYKEKRKMHQTKREGYKEKREMHRNCNHGDIANLPFADELIENVAFDRHWGACRVAVRSALMIQEAARVCAAWDMELARFDDNQEFKALLRFVETHNADTSDGYIATGLRYIDGDWRYPTDHGEITRFIPWEIGYPNDERHHGCTLLAHRPFHGWALRNIACTTRSFFVCQRDDKRHL